MPEQPKQEDLFEHDEAEKDIPKVPKYFSKFIRQAEIIAKEKEEKAAEERRKKALEDDPANNPNLKNLKTYSPEKK